MTYWDAWEHPARHIRRHRAEDGKRGHLGVWALPRVSNCLAGSYADRCSEGLSDRPET
jgi:hypothetical protein